MDSLTYGRHYPDTISERTMWLVAGFVFGALSVLLFHQGALALLHSIGFTANSPYSVKATPPWGIPQVWSIAFWGGVWGVLLAAAVHRLRDGALIAASTLFGLVLPTLAAWFIVAAMKGQPLAAGLNPKGMAVGLIVNAAWGLGVGVALALFARAPVIRLR
jgi:zinc transporter ZupT